MPLKSAARLKADVEAELDWDGNVVAPQLQVEADGGLVTLGGRVSSLAEKLAAEEAVRRVSGVHALATELVVIPEHRPTDEELARVARHALEWSALVPRGQVHVSVENGHVTLRGHVERGAQRRAAQRAVGGLRGVTAVTDRLLTSPAADPSRVARGISEALERQGIGGPEGLQVTLEGATVRLRGQVRSWAEREAAAQAAQSAQGVEDVLNEIVVCS